jgi:hypothetical protein
MKDIFKVLISTLMLWVMLFALRIQSLAVTDFVLFGVFLFIISFLTSLILLNIVKLIDRLISNQKLLEDTLKKFSEK